MKYIDKELRINNYTLLQGIGLLANTVLALAAITSIQNVYILLLYGLGVCALQYYMSKR